MELPGLLLPSSPLRTRSLLVALIVWMGMAVLPQLHAHTLPVSYLRLVANAEYLHIELVFNPFELTFISDVDANRDGELDPGELRKHGNTVATRVCAALKISVGGKEIAAESVGMDPDMAGHHVRLRAHYRVDARLQPVTVSSQLNSLTSSSHLVQASFHSGSRKELAQLTTQGSKATFNANPEPQDGKTRPAAPEREAAAQPRTSEEKPL